MPDGPEAHLQTTLVFDSNGQSLYDRNTVLGGGANWGFCASYGLRTANDYLGGGANPERIPSAYQKWDDLLSVSLDVSPCSRVEFDYVHCEMNNVQLPGVVYDLDSSTDSQFNLRYVVQEDRQGPKQLVIQGWYQETDYRGDALRQSKQDSFYYQFITLPATTDGVDIVNTLGIGQSINMGARCCEPSASATRRSGRSASTGGGPTSSTASTTSTRWGRSPSTAATCTAFLSRVSTTTACSPT